MSVTEIWTEISAKCSRQGHDIIRDINRAKEKESEYIYLNMRKNEEHLIMGPQARICSLIMDQVKSDKKIEDDCDFARTYKFSPYFISRLRNNRVSNISDENLLKFAVLYPRVVNGDTKSAALLAYYLAEDLNCNMNNKMNCRIIDDVFNNKVMGRNVYNDNKRAEYVYICLNKWLYHDCE